MVYSLEMPKRKLSKENKDSREQRPEAGNSWGGGLNMDHSVMACVDPYTVLIVRNLHIFSLVSKTKFIIIRL